MIQLLNLADGKYTFQYNTDTAELICLRYGSQWREFVGDHAMAELFARAWQTEHERISPGVLKHHLDAISDEYGHGDIWALLVQRFPRLLEAKR